MEVGDKDERAELETGVKEEREVDASVTRHSCQTHVSVKGCDRARHSQRHREHRAFSEPAVRVLEDNSSSMIIDISYTKYTPRRGKQSQPQSTIM